MSYWDAAYIAKFYLDEPESDRVRALAEAEGEASWMREGTFRQADLRELCHQLDADSEAGIWSWLPVSPAAIQLAGATLAGLPKGVALRAGDALHLATARVNEIAKVFSNDVRLLSAARYFEVAGSDPARA